MTKDIESLKTSIKKKLINFKESSFDLIDGKIDLQLSLSDQDFRSLEKEAAQINLSRTELVKLIDEVRSNINFAPRIENKRKIQPENLKLGQHIRLITRDDKGEAIEELIYIGQHNFILITHERGSLRLGDELKSITSPWNTEGSFIEFEVFRDDKRVIMEEKLSVYRTRPVIQIQLIHPQFDYDSLFVDEEVESQ